MLYRLSSEGHKWVRGGGRAGTELIVVKVCGEREREWEREASKKAAKLLSHYSHSTNRESVSERANAEGKTKREGVVM